MGIHKAAAVSGSWPRPSDRKDRDAQAVWVAMHNVTNEETATAGLAAYVRIGGNRSSGSRRSAMECELV